MTKKFLKNNIFPIILAVIVFLLITVLFYLVIYGLNLFPVKDKISLIIHPSDVIVGLTIYLKTSIDFALLIGILMNRYPGLKNRIAIEIGTALGNAIGTIAVLIMWVFFKEVAVLLALMIIFASLVLFKLAQVSLEHIGENNPATNIDNINQKPDKIALKFKRYINYLLNPINKFLDPFLSRVVPDLKFNTNIERGIKGLFIASFTIPFILGSDDFAGYVPLFNIVNVFGFGIGVFLGHMILNIFLFLSPNRTIKVIKNPFISILGSIAFIILAFWGLYEAFHVIMLH